MKVNKLISAAHISHNYQEFSTNTRNQLDVRTFTAKTVQIVTPAPIVMT